MNSLDIARKALEEAAVACQSAAGHALFASTAFEELKKAIEAEGYQVIRHMSGGYSVLKRYATAKEI